jgi:hypothetical protein
MILLKQQEINAAKEAQVAKDILRAESTKSALKTVQNKLDDTEARFDVALANQRIRWANEEADSVNRLDELNKEIALLEERKRIALIPIDDLRKKAEDIFKSAEDTFAEAKAKLHDAEQTGEDNEKLSEILENRVDDLTGREVDLLTREKALTVKELSIKEERELIKKLSNELLIKLQNV